MTYVLSIYAVDDLDQASSYYEEKRPGLGMQFLERFDEAIAKVVDRPESWLEYHLRTRLCMLKQFHYGIVYRLTDETIHVFGVVSLIRKPGYWANRLKAL